MKYINYHGNKNIPIKLNYHSEPDVSIDEEKLTIRLVSVSYYIYQSIKCNIE
jgi:hypothetical protein